ncbi:MAG: hypothetical protein QXF80_07405 [Thermoplasmatales archaeon]
MQLKLIQNSFLQDILLFQTLQEKELQLTKTGIELLEDSYLGGNGSRGYGKVEFDLKELEIRDLDYYRKKLEDRG